MQSVEVRHSGHGVVHHAVVYIREPRDTWTRGPTKADILAVHAPGSAPDVYPAGMAKLVKAGSGGRRSLRAAELGRRMMVGFFDVAVDASVDKPAFFVR